MGLSAVALTPTATADAVVIDETAQTVDPIIELATDRIERERERKRKARAARANTTAPPHLEAIAACESGGNPRAIGGGGAYRGKYQFDLQTWQSVGGSGDPAAAPEA